VLAADARAYLRRCTVLNTFKPSRQHLRPHKPRSYRISALVMYRLAVIQHAQAALVRRNVSTVRRIVFGCVFRHHAETAGTFGCQDAQQKCITKSTFAFDHMNDPNYRSNAPA